MEEFAGELQWENTPSGEREVRDPFGLLKARYPKTWRALTKQVEKGASPEEAWAAVGLTDEDRAALASVVRTGKAGDPKGDERTANTQRQASLQAQLDPAAYAKLSKQTGLDPQKMVQNMAWDLARYGVSDLGQVKAHTLPTGEAVFSNAETGQPIPTRFGSDMSGKGGSNFELVVGSDGAVVPVPKWKNTSDKSDIVGALTVLAVPVGGYLLAPAAGAAGAASAAAGASSGISLSALGETFAANFATNLAMTGGDIDRSFWGATKSTAVAGVGQLASPLISTIDLGNTFANTLAQAGARQAVGQGAVAAIRGEGLQGSLQEAGRGLLTGAAGSAVDQAAAGLTGSARIGRVAGGTARGAVGAAQSGDDIGRGAVQGLVSSGLQELGVPGAAAGAVARGLSPAQQARAGGRTTTTAEDLGSVFAVGRSVRARVSPTGTLSNNRVRVAA